MGNSLVEFFLSVFSNLPKELVVFLISLMPILVLRGGLVAASLLNIRWNLAFPLCILGNILPAPLVLLFINKIFSLLKKTRLKRIVSFFEEKAKNKSDKVLKYKEWGLFAFVAIPLPGTGCWTGALIAALMHLDFKKSILVISLGVIAAGVVMSVLSYLLPLLIKNF